MGAVDGFGRGPDPDGSKVDSRRAVDPLADDPDRTVITTSRALPASSSGGSRVSGVRQPTHTPPSAPAAAPTAMPPVARTAQPPLTPPAQDATQVRAAHRPRPAQPATPRHDDEATVVRPRKSSIGQPPLPVPPPAPRDGAPNALALPIGFRLLEYRIDGVLGQGGFGITYLATDVNLHAKVAIKEYLPASIAFRTSDKTVSACSTRDRDRYRQGLDSFLVEGRTLATFRHPNIVRVARFFEAHQTAYMVLEHERGDSLKEWWPKHSDLSEKDLVLLLQPLLHGLSVVHEAGFLHRDIKPQNIQVRQEDGSMVLLDFGSARQALNATDDADVVLTAGYAPIEQYENGQQTAATDIYALGATLYWMVSDKKPVDADRRSGAVDPMVPAVEAGRGRFSPQFLAAIDWALKPEPQDRPADIAQWQSALFAAHASSVGLQEALRARDAADTADSTTTDGSGRQSARSLGARLTSAMRSLIRPGSWPLAVKMTLAMVLTALLPMFTTAYYNLQGSTAAVSEGELRNLEQLARSTAGRLSQLANDSRNLARSLGTDADFPLLFGYPDDAAKEAMLTKLDALVKANPDIHFIMVMDTEGLALVASDRQVMGKNFKFRDYFKAAMAGKPYVTGLVVGSVAGEAGMFYASPVFDRENKVVGAVVLRIRGSSFASILDEVREGSQRTPFLIDGDGVLVHHPDPRLLYSSLRKLPDDKMAAIRADQRFRRDRIESLDMPVLADAMVGAKSLGHVSYWSSVSRENEIAGYAPVKGLNWVVGVSESTATFQAPLNRLFDHLLWSVALVGLLFLGLALMFARSIVSPIRALTNAAHALKRGDYAHANLTVKRRDEIGQLARTFNVMIDVLRQRERERAGPRRGNNTSGRKSP